MNILRDVSLFAGVILFTVVKVGALAIWLILVWDAEPLSVPALVGVSVLFVGLTLKQVITDVSVNGFLDDLPIGRLAFVAVIEALLWVGWLSLAEGVGDLLGVLVAGLVLTVLLIPLHTFADNVVRRDRLFDRIFDLRTLDFSIIEGLGATVWLLLVIQSDRVGEFWVDTGQLGAELGGDAAVIGIGVLAVALFAEHIVGVQFMLR